LEVTTSDTRFNSAIAPKATLALTGITMNNKTTLSGSFFSVLNNIKSVRVLVAMFLSMALISVAAAQSVSSNVRGIILDASGSPVANATVVIRHVPSGTTRTATTSNSGNYNQSGLRVGGPYKLSISADGYRGTVVEEVYLKAGAQALLDVALESESEAIEEIVVTATAAPLKGLNNGVGSAYSAEDIGNQPSITRDVIRTLMRDPLAQSSGSTGNLSVAGVNPRFNGLAIDGSLQQDDFGLGSSTYATARSPINLDAVESASLVASDYAVTSSGFTGGLVNLVTKSGTNDWNGSAFYYFQNDSMLGDTYDGDRTRPFTPLDEKEYGVTLGGPILKDRLFFFVSYDEFESARSVDFTNADISNGIEPGFFETLRTEITNALGYDPGPRPQTANTPVTSKRALVKLDWNVNDLHRASFTYQSTEETGSSVSALGFSSSWYDVPVDLKAYTFQFFSDWTDDLSTTFRINKKDFERGQLCNAGTGVGHIEVENLDSTSVIGTPLEGLLTDDPGDIIAGCDRFRQANEFKDERLQFLAKADYSVGDHVVTGGMEYEDFSLRNLFISGGARGRFQYDSYDDLVIGLADVNYQNDVSNDANNAAANWGYKKWTLFLQDTWQVSQDLEVGFGIRYERYDQSDKPQFSQTIFDTYGLRSDTNLDGRDLVLPRISFNWQLGDRTTLAGGFGRFSGGDPKVWTSNAFQLPTVFTSGQFANTDPTVIPQALLDNVANGTPLPIDVIAEDFEIPSDWKASLRIEQGFDLGALGDDYIFTAQYIYTQTSNGFLWTNLAQTELNSTTPLGVAPDGRPIYADLQALGIDNLTQLGNFDGGVNQIITLGLAKRYDYGLDFNFSYAYQDVEAVTEGNSSRGISNWRGIIDADRNNPGVKISPFQVKHSLKLSVGYEKDFFKTGQSMTRVDLFGRRWSGDLYTQTFNVNSSNSLFGRAGQFESPFDNSPLYIPSGPSDPTVVYASGFDQQAFFEYVKNAGSGINKPNSNSTDWNTIWDLRIQQEIPGLSFLGNSIGDNNFKIVLDIENILNLFNNKWGAWVDGPRFLDNRIVTADMVTAADVAANGIDNATALLGDSPRTTCTTQATCVYRYNSFSDRTTQFTSSFRSVYKIRLGIRFDF